MHKYADNNYVKDNASERIAVSACILALVYNKLVINRSNHADAARQKWSWKVWKLQNNFNESKRLTGHVVFRLPAAMPKDPATIICGK